MSTSSSFQVIFSFSVLSVYALWTKSVGRDIAFLCAIWYVSFPTFINDLPMLNRQEIALFFFALMLLTVFSPNMRTHERTVLFGIYGFGIAVSHYSTAYVAVALVALTLALSICLKAWQSKIGLGPFRKWWNQADAGPQARNWTVVGTSTTMVILLVLQVLTWNVLVTRSADHLVAVLQSVVTKIDEAVVADSKSSSVS